MFATLGIKSLISVFSIRNLEQSIWKYNPFSNLYLTAAVFISTSLLVVGVVSPTLQTILKTESLSVGAWLSIIVFGLFSLFLIEIVKTFFIYAKEKK